MQSKEISWQSALQSMLTATPSGILLLIKPTRNREEELQCLPVLTATRSKICRFISANLTPLVHHTETVRLLLQTTLPLIIKIIIKIICETPVNYTHTSISSKCQKNNNNNNFSFKSINYMWGSSRLHSWTYSIQYLHTHPYLDK